MAIKAMTVNGIDVQYSNYTKESGNTAARRLAASLPRGGDMGEGSIRRIDAPISKTGKAEVWLNGDGYVSFDAPDGWEITSVSAFETPGACVTVERE
jgi:hypothetical protein